MMIAAFTHAAFRGRTVGAKSLSYGSGCLPQETDP